MIAKQLSINKQWNKKQRSYEQGGKNSGIHQCKDLQFAPSVYGDEKSRTAEQRTTWTGNKYFAEVSFCLFIYVFVCLFMDDTFMFFSFVCFVLKLKVRDQFNKYIWKKIIVIKKKTETKTTTTKTAYREKLLSTVNWDSCSNPLSQFSSLCILWRTLNYQSPKRMRSLFLEAIFPLFEKAVVMQYC